MSTLNPHVNNAINKKASSVASTFSLPPAPPASTTSSTTSGAIPSTEDGHVLPFASAELRRMLKAQENFVTNTEPSWFATLPPSKTKIIPQPPAPLPADSSSNRGAAFRSALVREAAKFVEDPDNFKDAYKRASDQANNADPSSSLMFRYDKEYEEKMRNFLLKKSSTDGSSNLAERRRIEESLAKNNQRDHQAFLASQRLEVENEETEERTKIDSWFDETTSLLLSRGGAVIDQYFEEELRETESLERRDRLHLTGIHHLKEFGALQLLFASDRFLIQFTQLWRDGLDKTADVLDYITMEGFVLKQSAAAQILQKCGRGFQQGRRALGQQRWQLNVGKDQVQRTFRSTEQEFEDAQLALKRRFEMHEVEAFEQFCRRVILEQAFTGLNSLQFNCTQVMIVLGEYDCRRKILVDEEQIVSKEVIPQVVNPIRYDLFHVISHRMKMTLQRRFDFCQHVKDAVLVLQNKFSRPALRGELCGSRSNSKLKLREALAECIAKEPIRPLSKLTKALRRTILLHSQEQLQQREFDRNYAPIICSEEIARKKMIQIAQESLRRLYNLCFNEGSVAAIAGAGEAKQLRPSSAEALLLNNNTETKKAEQSSSPSSSSSLPQQQQQQQRCIDGNNDDQENEDDDINDERFTGTRPVYETLLQKDRYTKTKVETIFKFCHSVNRYCLLVTSYQRPTHLNFVHVKSAGQFHYSRLCRQFLAPSFHNLRPVDFPEIEWYRLRGAVDVSPLVEEACRAGNKAAASQIYARTIGQLIKRRRATSAEIRTETLGQLQAQALARLAVEMDEWNSRWLSAVQMLQDHSRLLLALDWQRTWTRLRGFCEEDEVAILQFLATQNFDQYKQDVSNLLRGVQRANEEIHRERNWVPRIIATAENKRRRERLLAKREEERRFIEEQSRVVVVSQRPQQQNTTTSMYDDDDDDEEEENIDFWLDLAKNNNKNNNNRHENNNENDVPVGAVVLDMYDDDDEDQQIPDENEVDDDDAATKKRLEQERFYQQLYGDSEGEEEENV